MKKTIVLGVLLLTGVASGYAQESRQDVSLSGYGLYAPTVHGNAITFNGTESLGALVSYRYMLSPRSALELNYSFTQNVQKYQTSFTNARIHSRQQELSGAYVYSLNFRNFNPFVEAGVGGMIFSPLQDYETTTHDSRQNTNVGALFGGGVAYELSPSFDIRAQYRGFLMRAPNFGFDDFKTGKYEVITMPAIGVAYHF